MKKILLTLGLFSLVLIGKSQTVLNEVYVEPGTDHSEFFELYNSSLAGAQSVNCFTVVTYWKTSATTRGVYILDLPNQSVSGHGFFVGAAANPFSTQNHPSPPGVVPNFNWNDPNFRNGSTGGSLMQYQVNGSVWTDISSSIPTTLNDLMPNVSIGGGTNYITLVFVNGAFNNGFWGGGSTGTLPSEITSLPDLPVTMNGCSNFTIHFNLLGAVEFVNQAAGNDNGYIRTSDGKCGAWDKASAGHDHTPGSTNGSATGLTGSLTTAQLINCSTSPTQQSYVNFNITGFSGAVNLADDFPVEVQVWKDANHNTQIDGSDVYINSKFIANTSGSGDTVKYFPVSADLIIIYKTKRGCFDRVVSLVSGCAPLPVKLTYFNAKRNNASNVGLTWQTAQELNSSGFEIQRQIGSGGWQVIAFVPTQAIDGNSNSMLNYSFNDPNNAKGITQYRLRAVDIDANSKFSEIRAVRGEGQAGKIIIYPNPSFDGKVKVVFEDVNGTRDVSLTDMSGRLVKQWTGVTNNNLQIDNMTPGYYSLRIIVRETGEQSIEKLVVNKR